jgi:hypothetical protein
LRSWTPDICKQVDYTPSSAKSDDGVFWMAFSDFAKNFTEIYVLRIFKPISQGGSWYHYGATGKWSGASAGGSFSTSDKAQNNPQYVVQPTKATRIVVVLRQAEVNRGGVSVKDSATAADARLSYTSISFTLADADGLRIGNEPDWASLYLTSGDFEPSRQVTAEGVIEKDYANIPLSLLVATYNPDEECEYSISVYVQCPLADTDGECLRLISPDTEAYIFEEDEEEEEEGDEEGEEEGEAEEEEEEEAE